MALEMDPLLAAQRLPRIADAAMRNAVVAALASGKRPTLSALVGDALVRFERAVQLKTPDGIRPALLFAQRDRILRGLRGFLELRVAARLFGVRSRDLIAVGSAAKPFDAIVRGRDGHFHAVVLRAIPRDGRRLDLFRRIRVAARNCKAAVIESIVVCDLDGGRSRRLRVEGGSLGRAA
jgi:hypothetical protein